MRIFPLNIKISFLLWNIIPTTRDVCPTSIVYCQLDYSGEWYGNQYHIFSEEIIKSFKMEIILKYTPLQVSSQPGPEKALRYFSAN